MEGWRIQQVHSILYKQEEKNQVQEILQNDPQDSYNWVRNTLIYKFTLTNSIRLDYLILAFKSGYINLSFGQLLNLTVEIFKHLINKKRYFNKCCLKNIWINLKQTSPKFDFIFQRIDYEIQFIGYTIQNEEAPLDIIIYPVITQLADLFPENIQLQLYKILAIRPFDQLIGKLEQFRNETYDYQTQLLNNNTERIKQPENIKECQNLKRRFFQITENYQDIQQYNFDDIIEHRICLEKLILNLKGFRLQTNTAFMSFCCAGIDHQEISKIEKDPIINLMEKFKDYESKIKEYLDNDLNQFQELMNSKCNKLELHLSQNFRTLLQQTHNLSLKEYFFFQGWLNDKSKIQEFLAIQGNNFRFNLEQQIYETEIKRLVIDQLNNQIMQYINGVLRNLTLN